MEDCLCHFERICGKAFPRLSKRGIPVLAWIRDRYKPKPETTAFEVALKGAFPETQHLFGEPRPSGKPGSHIKVAVTAASSAGRTVLLGNYNRYASKKRTYLVLGQPIVLTTQLLNSWLSFSSSGKNRYGVKSLGGVSNPRTTPIRTLMFLGLERQWQCRDCSKQYKMEDQSTSILRVQIYVTIQF
jgi:hypothetical protein